MEKRIYQIQVTLRHCHPPIWRRIQVAGETRLGELHDILQISMGWTDSHLHAFQVGGDTYGVPDPDFPGAALDERNVSLDRIAAAGDTLVYEYDFGDGWAHELTVEQVLEAGADASYPRCVDGARACPPEDCGGPPGYDRLLGVLDDPRHPEYAESCDWLGDGFDPEAFDPAEVNALLREWALDVDAATPVPSDAALADLDELSLLDTLRRLEDRAPRHLIDACAGRGEAMVLALENLTAAPGFWGGRVNLGSWWLRLHAAMILGLIASEEAGRQLISLMRSLDRDDDQSTQDWLAGQWPALFANKPPALQAALRALAEDRSHDWYLRIQAVECALSFARRAGPEACEAALDWAASMAADEGEESVFRFSLCGELLDSPRSRHRALLDDLAARQTGLGRHFDERDIDYAFGRGEDAPNWENLADPWVFYDPESIAGRQRRWVEADEDHGIDDSEWSPQPIWNQPYMRTEAKIGRNDPCPCGSGKKYKKCCLPTLH